MKMLPEGAEPYKRTATFTDASAPSALRHRHTTKDGAWAKIVVVSGSLRYQILEPLLEEHLLSPGRPGIVEPAVPHELHFHENCEFYVEFYREARRRSA